MSGRGKKAAHHPRDLYVLGPKGSRIEGGDSKRALPGVSNVTASSSISGSSTDRKKFPICGITSAQARKKSGHQFRVDPLIAPNDAMKSWENVAIDIDPIDLIPTFLEAKDKMQTDKLVAIICGAIRLLKNVKKMDPVLLNSFLYLVKLYPTFFVHETITNALCAMLRKEYKGKVTNNTMIFISNLLYYVFKDVKQWPENFLRAYIDDALNDRVWVDSEHSKCFSDNIVSSVNTILPSTKVDTDSDPKFHAEETCSSVLKNYRIFPRYSSNEEGMESLIVEIIKDQLLRRPAMDNMGKNFLRFLYTVCGITEVRAIIVSRLEVWLSNPKLVKSAQDLLMSVCVNSVWNSQKDLEIVSSIVRIRFKSKSLHSYYCACIKELIAANGNNLSTILKQIISNELSTSRNQNNMIMLSGAFQCEPVKCASILAEIFVEYLTCRDNYLISLRGLLKEMAKVLRTNLHLKKFAKGLLTRKDVFPRDFDIKERMFHSMADLTAMCILLYIAPTCRIDKRENILQMEEMQRTVAKMQRNFVEWLAESAVYAYKPSANDITQVLYKVFFMESAESYYKSDSWSSELDRNAIFRQAVEVPVLEKTLLVITRMALAKDNPWQVLTAAEFIEHVVKRCCTFKFNLNIPVLQVESTSLLDKIFELSAYTYPENITLPSNYKPPVMAIGTCYWKAWVVTLIYCTLCPEIFGKKAWEEYPTLRILVEMCITGHFVWPTSSQESQFKVLEKQKILEFEGHLAAASSMPLITEENSLLLSVLTALDVKGPTRKPPPYFLEELQSLNASHKIGHLLCHSRNPDYLVDIIREQGGASQSMPWLADLVQNAEGSLNHLPVQCLCEFLLSSGDKHNSKYVQLLQHLQLVLRNEESANESCEILNYFLHRLGGQNNKEQAISCLKLLLDPDLTECPPLKEIGEECSDILNKLPNLLHFQFAKFKILKSLCKACQEENDANLITAYIMFLAKHGVRENPELSDLVVHMANVIVQRSTISSAILPSIYSQDLLKNEALNALFHIFHAYIVKAREPQKEGFAWSKSQAQVRVTWTKSGEEVVLNIMVAEAMVVLLIYGSDAVSNKKFYSDLMDIWFPEDRENMPKAFLMDTLEEAVLLPEWLKLRMMTSKNVRLVDEALHTSQLSNIIVFVQSFGIPVFSMSKLLQKLDQAALEGSITDHDLAAVNDIPYMIQLVEVQNKRGVVGGQRFSHYLMTYSHAPRVTFYNNLDVKKLMANVNLDADPKLKGETPDLVDISAPEQILSVVENLWNYGAVRDSVKKLLCEISKELCDTRRRVTPTTSELLRAMSKKMADAAYCREIARNCQHVRRLLHAMATSQRREHCLALRNIASNLSRYAPSEAIFMAKLKIGLSSDEEEMDVQVGSGGSGSSQEPHKLNVESCLPNDFESIGKKLLEVERGERGNEGVVQAIADMMTKMKMEGSCQQKMGSLIDWLVDAEPEIIGSSVQLQLDMLFSRESNQKWKCTHICRPYLLTLLAHRASWPTLDKAISSLLNINAVRQYEACAVLEFLCALASNPKFWQGREKRLPKHKQRENMLHLSEKQLLCVVQYIMHEVEDGGCDMSAFAKMNNRLTQLVDPSISADKFQLLTRIVEYTVQTAEKNRMRKNVCGKLLAEFYLRMPKIMEKITDMQLNATLDMIFEYEGGSALDIMAHGILTSYTSETTSREWPDRMANLDLLIKKMATCHPKLILRQLNLLKASLMGKNHLEWATFRSKNHFALYQHVLSILTLLQPHIFTPAYTQMLHEFLDCYLILLKNYSGVKELSTVITKLLPMIQNYIEYDTKRAVTYLEGKASLLRQVEMDFPSVGNLCIFTSSMNDPGNKQLLITTTAVSENMGPKLDAIVRSLNTSEDMLKPLQELDNISNRKPALLESTLEHIFPSLHQICKQTRTLAHKLLARSMADNPSNAKRIVPAVFNCLYSKNPLVVESALDKLPELIVTSQENALIILRQVFSLGVINCIDVTSCVSKTISLLNLQSNC